jgi:hypothetical protein
VNIARGTFALARPTQPTRALGLRGGCWFWVNELHNPRLLATHGTPLIVGVPPTT